MPADVDGREVVGLAEISGMLGVPPATVASWRHRGLLPVPRWQLKAGPVWLADDVRIWYEREKGPVATSPPDQLQAAIDLSAEPHRAEVYAHFGLALGEAQILERHLASVIGLLHPPPVSQQMLVQIIEQAERKTMGQLKEELKKFGAPVIGIDSLERAVARRNFLGHHFFVDPERSVKMTNDLGRESLIAELDEVAADFWRTAQYLRAAQVRIAMQRGVSKNDVMERIRRVRSGEEPLGPIGRKSAPLLMESPDLQETVEVAFDEAERIAKQARASPGGKRTTKT
jgi:prophage regulatory protein